MALHSGSEITQSLVMVSHGKSILPTKRDALLEKIESLYDMCEEKNDFAKIFYNYAELYFRLNKEQLSKFSPEELDTMADALAEEVSRRLRKQTLVFLAIPFLGWIGLCACGIPNLIDFWKFKRLHRQLKEKLGDRYVSSALNVGASNPLKEAISTL